MEANVPASRVLRVEDVGRVRTLWFERPPLHILNIPLLRAINDELERAGADDAVSVVVLRGSGARAFSTGVDVADHTAERIEEMLGEVERQVAVLTSIERVTVAVIQGYALGGGLELAALCDITLAGMGALCGLPEVTLGVVPPIAAAVFPLMGAGAGWREALLTGRPYPAQRWVDWGVLGRVVADADVDGELGELTDHLASLSGMALANCARTLRRVTRPAALDALRKALAIYRTQVIGSRDGQEGIAAYVEKRTPRWEHR